MHDLFAVTPLDVRDDDARPNLDAFLAKITRDGVADVAVFRGQQMLRADEERRTNAHPEEKLTEFGADVTATEHDDRFGNARRFEDGVAIEISGFHETRHDRRCDHASGRDDEAARLEYDVLADPQMRR
jgi:hypothetical protein